MTLRDLGVFAPLKYDHPAVGKLCWKCKRYFGGGSRVALNSRQTVEEANSLTVQAELVCATCHLKGEEIETPSGRRIVERIKNGDASPYPVETTDGRQWKADEVGV